MTAYKLDVFEKSFGLLIQLHLSVKKLLKRHLSQKAPPMFFSLIKYSAICTAFKAAPFLI